MVLAVYVPALHGPFGTASLGPAEAAVVLLLALVPAAVAEAGKALLRAVSGKPNVGAGTTTMAASP